MMTVREKLMGQAATSAERELLEVWFQDKAEPYVSRQRAWEEVARRARRGQPDLMVRW